MNDPDRRHTSDGFDHDAMFAEIVAHWNEAAAEPERLSENERRSQNENEAASTPTVPPAPDPPAPDPPAPDPPAPDPLAPSPGSPSAIPAPRAWRAHEVDDDYEEHFEPPPVAPLPAGDLQFWGIIVGMGGGPLLLLYLVLFSRDSSSYWMLAAISMSVAGFALLVARLPRDHDEDEGNGARL